MKLLVSRAHEVVLQSFSKDRYTCLMCGKKGDIKSMFSDVPEERCTPHFESATSGWKDEFDAEMEGK